MSRQIVDEQTKHKNNLLVSALSSTTLLTMLRRIRDEQTKHNNNLLVLGPRSPDLHHLISSLHSTQKQKVKTKRA